MARREYGWAWGLAALLAVATFGAAGVAYIKTHSNPPAKRDELQRLADKWAPVFGARPSDMMAIGKIESAWRPDTVNWSVRSIPLGGAWGPWQMTKTAANDWAARLRNHKDAAVRAVASRWKGNGEQLTRDLELAAVLTAAFLGGMTQRFKEFKLVAGAYHQGAGKIAQMLRDKKAIPEELPPKGKEYVRLALAARNVVVA